MSRTPLERPGASTGSVRLGLLAVLGVLSAGLVLAACGGSSSNQGVAHLGSSTGSASTSAETGGSSRESPAALQKKMVAFARCMRAHGVPNFPEPSEGKIVVHDSSSGGLKSQLKSGPSEAADKACRKLLPEGGTPSPQARAQAQKQALDFSRCMRSHGVPNFPTPEISGGRISLKISAGGANGVDPRSPQFQSAQKACQAYFGPGGKGGPGAGPTTQGSVGGGAIGVGP